MNPRGRTPEVSLRVQEALADGTYGATAFTPEEVPRLREIFPGGVCDWTRPDVGRPADL